MRRRGRGECVLVVVWWCVSELRGMIANSSTCVLHADAQSFKYKLRGGRESHTLHSYS